MRRMLKHKRINLYLLISTILLSALFMGARHISTALPIFGSNLKDSTDIIHNYNSVDLNCRLYSVDDSLKNIWIDSLLHASYKAGRFNGTVLFAENGRIIYKGYFGYSNISTKDTLTNHVSLQLASVSKPFTAMAVLLLRYDGKVDIDKDVKTYIPDFPWDGVTVRHLLNQRSGLPNYIYAAENFMKDKSLLSNDSLSKLFIQQNIRLAYKPGLRFQYCNTNYAYLALLVERVSGMKFAEFMRKRIFEPLKMNNSFVYDYAEQQDSLPIKGYTGFKKGLMEKKPDYLDGVVGDKGLYSTVEDMFKFDRAMYEERLIPRPMLEEAFSPVDMIDETNSRDYGFGWRLKWEIDHKVVYHNGWWKGYRTYYIHDEQTGKTLIWLNNRSNIRIGDLIAKIMNYPKYGGYNMVENETGEF